MECESQLTLVSIKMLLDTNILSEIIKTNPDPNVAQWFAAQAKSSLVACTPSEAEMRYGVMLVPAGAKKARLELNVSHLFERVFVNQLLPFDSKAAATYAKVSYLRRTLGRPIQAIDAQIAAIALANQHALVTRNTRDFEGLGLTLINPFGAEHP
jgi:toxin FitB